MGLSADNKEARFKEAAKMSNNIYKYKVTVSFEMGNDDSVGRDPTTYASIVLRNVAEKMSDGFTEYGRVVDDNGNSIGQFRLEDVQ